MASSSSVSSLSFPSSLTRLNSKAKILSPISLSSFSCRPWKNPSSSSSRHQTVAPNLSDIYLPSKNSPIKNLKKKKKKLEDRLEAKASAPTVTETLDEKIRKKQWEEALEVFEMLKQQIFYYPKAGTYKKLLVLLGKSGQAIRAHKLFDTMVEEGIEPTSQLYTTLLAAYCRSSLIEEAYSVLAKMKTLPLCQPDVFTYSILVKTCVEGSRFELVNSLYQEMSDHMITPNTVTQNIVLGGYGKAGMFNEMEKVLCQMLESKMCKPDVSTIRIVLSLYGNNGQIDMMEKWYEKFCGIGFEPESQTFNILICAYGRKRMYDKMTAAMENMRKLEFPWTISTYNIVIEAFADIGDAENMEYVFNQMCEDRIKADTKTFSSLIDGFSNAGLFNKAVSSIQLAEKLEVPFKTSLYNSVLYACAKAGDLLEMENVFKHMKDKHPAPNSATYSILVEAYRREGIAEKIFDLEQEEQKMSALELIG